MQSTRRSRYYVKKRKGNCIMAFTREFLKGLNIEGDNLEKIMTEYGKSHTESAELQKKVEDLTSQNETLTGQIKERDGQLKTLSKSAGDNEELKTQIKSLQDSNKQTATEYQAKLAEQSKNFKIDSALRDAKARNPKAVKALLDLDKVSVDGDNLVGFKDQLEAVKKDNDYMFESGKPNESAKQGVKVVTGGNPGGNGGGEPSIVQRIAQRMTGGE